MPSPLRKATLLISISIAAAVGLAGIAHATPIGIDEYKNHGQYVSEVAKTKDLGSENHGYYVSQAAKQRGGGVSAREYVGSVSPLNSQSTISSALSVSSPLSVAEPGAWLLLSTGFVGLLLWNLWWRQIFV